MQEEMKSVPVFLPGKFHGQRSLVGRTPRGCKESGTTERVHTHTHTHNMESLKAGCFYLAEDF